MERDDGYAVRPRTGKRRLKPSGSIRGKLLGFGALLLACGFLFSLFLVRTTLWFSAEAREATYARQAYYQGYAFLTKTHLAMKNVTSLPDGPYREAYMENRRGLGEFMSLLGREAFGPYAYDLARLCGAYISLADEAVRQAEEGVKGEDAAEHVYGLMTSFASYSMNEMEEQLSLRMERANNAFGARLRLYLVALALVMAAGAAAVFIFTDRLIKPLEELTDMALSGSQNTWEIRTPPEARRDEVGLLYTSFVRMMNKIRRQYDELLEKQRLEVQLKEEREKAARAQALVSDTRLKVFQSRINSHFLFNTLTMIARMAYMEKAPNVQKASNLLAQFLRNALSQYDREVTLEEEFETVNDYIEIQKLRFGDRICFEESLDPEAADIHIPAVTLQPLIENAIIHGLSRKKSGFIRYSAEWEEDELFLGVYDDGGGMSEEQAQALLARLEAPEEEAGMKKGGIGIKNVFERLKLMFSGRVRPVVESEEGVYTRIGFFIRQAALVLVLALGLFAGRECQAGEAAPESFRATAIIPYKPDVVFWKEIGEGLRAEAGRRNVALTMIYTEANEKYVPMDINSALETAILVHTGAIILSFSADADEKTEELLIRAREEGIYVVLVDNDADASLRDACVTIDNREAGAALGRLAAEGLEDGQKALLVYSGMTEDRMNMAQRLEGIRSVFPEGQLMEWKSDEKAPSQDWSGQLSGGTAIGAVITVSERSTVAASQLLARDPLLSGIKVYGFDYTEETAPLLSGGSAAAIVGQQPFLMGSKSVETALALLREGSLPSDMVYIDYEIYR